MLQQETGLYLGPATVTRALGRRALVRRSEAVEETWAELALAFPYQPVPGDRVLVAAQDDRSYVIGVLLGRGPSVLAFPGDVTVSALQGSLHLEAGKAVTLSAPEVEVRADSVDLEAKTLTERVENAYRWVKELLQVRAGRSRAVVDGTHHQLAERTFIRSEKETKVDGEKIFLG